MQVQELFNSLKEQQAQKSDYIVTPSGLSMRNGNILAKGTKGLIYTPNDIFHEGLRSKLEIPKSYYQRMQSEKPDLLDTNVNAWLSTLPKDGMMLRAFETPNGNIARAFLSDRYQAIDNYDILFAVLQCIKAAGINAKIEDANVTDKKMYLYITCPDVEVQAKNVLDNYLKDRPDYGNYGIVSGVCVSNSEVGCGLYSIRAMAKIRICGNRMIGSEDAFRKIHLGGKLTAGSINWSAETKRKNMELIMAQSKDAIRQFISEGYLTTMVQKLQSAHERELKHPVDTIANVCKDLNRIVVLSEEEEKNILNYFITDGDPKASGIFSSLTRVAQEMNPDARFDTEAFAFSLLSDVGKFDKPSSKFSLS